MGVRFSLPAHLNIMNPLPLLVILGPTATGKSDLAVQVALKIRELSNGKYNAAEIISADSRQVYKGLDIGTGKITMDEMHGIKHHLLDVVSPRKRFAVIDYKKIAEKAIQDISGRGNLPIICGGTGFYIDAVVYNVDFPRVPANRALRKTLAQKSVDELYTMLEKIHPARAKIMNHSDRNNPVRLIRAIEIAKEKEGRHDSENQPAKTSRMVVSKSPLQKNYDSIFIGLQADRNTTNQRIHKRLLDRIEHGMIEEAINLHKTSKNNGSNLSWKRMEELGLEYRYLSRYLQKKLSKDEMVAKLYQEICNYSKRQMTWFKRNGNIAWFDLDKKAAIFDLLRSRFK